MTADIQPKVLVVKNITREGPGLLMEVLRENGIRYDLIDLDKGEEFPDPRGYSAVFVFGGPDSANDKTSKMRDELKRVKEAIDAEVPYLGVCLGMQILVKATGGEVYTHEMKEAGWRNPEGEYFEVYLTDKGKVDPLFEDLGSSLKIFHLHGETVRLGPKTTLLATGKHCRNQIVKVGEKAYGFQGHFELTQEMLEEWIIQDPDLNLLDPAYLKSDHAAIKAEYEATGKQILRNFLRVADILE